jgi:glutamate formiminotransferase
MSPLLAVPNVSEGRDQELIGALAAAASSAAGAEHARLLDVHCDPDHNRSVLTIAGDPPALIEAVLAVAQLAVRRIDLRSHRGAHPRVGALDVAPIVHTTSSERGVACASALVLAARLGEEVGVPVLLYGALSGTPPRTRAQLRRGGPAELAARIAADELSPDFGPGVLHRSAGATLVAARPPLVAFNVELAPPAGVEEARRIAALVREGGAEGLPGVRAIGVELTHRGTAQVSTNLEEPLAGSPARVVEAISRHAVPLRAELVGLAPAASLEGLSPGLPLANRRTLEDALSAGH